MDDTQQLLLWLCDAAYAAEKRADEDHKKELFGDVFVPELLLMRKDHIRIEIRKENVSHNEPHLHVVHSDKIDASISLNSFAVLAGNIDRQTLKYFKKLLSTKQKQLLAIWEELNEKENSVGAEKLISDLGL
jgi:Domain of unknown function (DUF4160)